VRPDAPFRADDLAELDSKLLGRATSVVAMEDIAAGADRAPGVIGMRHDCDNVIEPAVHLAQWEAERGYRSTYFILHTSPYWDDKPLLQRSLEQIANSGHEIGIHLDALTAALMHGGDPLEIAHQAIEELRGYGYPITGSAAHGHRLCREVGYVNDEIFVECRRHEFPDGERVLHWDGRDVKIQPVPLATFGLTYDSPWLPRDIYLSDSGGRWSQPFDTVAAEYHPGRHDLHMLVHPDWWGEAF